MSRGVCPAGAALVNVDIARCCAPKDQSGHERPHTSGPSLWSMTVAMVSILRMRVRVRQQFMPIPMNVLTLGHRVVVVIVMDVIALVRARVLESLMFVAMATRFGEMHEHTRKHQRACSPHHPPECSVAKQHLETSADEWRERNCRTCSCSAPAALWSSIRTIQYEGLAQSTCEARNQRPPQS